MKEPVADPAVRDRKVLLQSDLNVPWYDGTIADKPCVRVALPTLSSLDDRCAFSHKKRGKPFAETSQPFNGSIHDEGKEK